MSARVLFILVLLCVGGTALTTAFFLDKLWMVYVAAGVAVVLLLLLFRSIIKPQHTVERGMELIASQDFNNRLTSVGEVESDKIVKLFNSMIDKLRNERLKNIEQQSLLQLLIDASPMGVAMLDFNHRVTLVNGAFLRITGVSGEEDALGRKIEDLDSDLSSKMKEVGLGANAVIRIGDVRMYRCYHLSFVQTGFNREFYLLETLTEEVMKAERAAYEKVIRIISHEVNNTMGGVRSVLDMLADSVDDEDVEAVIESCDNRCEKMCDFISSYADVVKVPDPVKSETDLNELIGKLLPFLKEMAGDISEVTFTPFDNPVVAYVDKALLEQVIVNVVKNGLESIEGEGKVEITTVMESGRASIIIANNGVAISEEVSRQLFSPFFTTKKEGRGLGLTLISEILNRHEARFSLRTCTDGITRFRIQF